MICYGPKKPHSLTLWHVGTIKPYPVFFSIRLNIRLIPMPDTWIQEETRSLVSLVEGVKEEPYCFSPLEMYTI